MQQFSFILDNFLRGRATYAPLRRILDVVFSLSIASFLFERFYFEYQWLDITDYKGIINFFIKGDFIVPFLLFLASHYLTYGIAFAFFTLSTTRKSTKWITRIIKFKLKKRDFADLTKKINNNPAIKMPVKLQSSWVINTYHALKESVNEEQWKKADTEIKKQKLNIEKNFILVSKAIIAISIYFGIVPHFGVLLYSITLVCLAALLALLWYAYLVLDVLPTIVRKIDSEVQQHLATEAMESQQSSS